MGFESGNKKSGKESSLKKAVLFATVLSQGGLMHDAGASEREGIQARRGVDSVQQSAPSSSLSENELMFLREHFLTIDSSVLAWKVSGYVPDAWEHLSDADLSALVTYINSYRDSKVMDLLTSNRLFGAASSKQMQTVIRKGIIEMIEMYKIPDEAVPVMTWGELATKTIYKIHRNPK